MTRPIQFGIMLPMWDYQIYDVVSFEQLLAMARAGERLGYDFVSVDDHLQRGAGGRAFESLTTLTALAAKTERVRLHTTVLCAMYRPPALLAKMAAVIDVISGGRLELGIGAGWKEEEARAYGLPWDGTKGRLDRLEEACQVLLAMWTQSPASFTGKYYSLVDAACDPHPVQRPHPPLWIGGGGEKRTLRIAAEYADGVNFAGPGTAGGPTDPLEYFIHKREVLYGHCRDVGRDPAEITLSSGSNLMLWGRSKAAVEARFKQRAAEQHLSEPERRRLMHSMESGAATPSDAADAIARHIEQGATSFTVGRATLEGLEMFAEDVMPRFRSARAPRGGPARA
jgi:F420-dependent oxidoreductase-like protein